MRLRDLRLPVLVMSLITGFAVFGQPPGDSPRQARYLNREELSKRYDRDGDDVLSPEERRAMGEDIVAGRVPVPPQMRENVRKQMRAPQGQTPRGRVPQLARHLMDRVTIQRDVVFGDAGSRPLKLDLVLPKTKSDAARPLVVFVHGGGWRSGDKAGGMGRVVPFVATGDYVGASIEYRLSGEATWPAQIHDCKAAIRWLKAHAADYHIDPERIGVWGSSAGGHLVNLLGTTGDVGPLEGACGTPDQTSRVCCVVSFCGPADFLAPQRFEGGRSPTAVDLLLGGSAADRRELAREASPITYVSADDPPFLLCHGTADSTVPFEQATVFHESLRKAGVDVTLVKIVGGGHAVGGEEVRRRVQAFFAKHLLGHEVEVSEEPIEVGEIR